MQVSTYTRKTLYMVGFILLSRVCKTKTVIKMKWATLIQGLIFVLVVSLAVASVYAGEVGDVSHEVSHDDSTGGIDGLYISGSGDVCHVASCNQPLENIATLHL